MKIHGLIWHVKLFLVNQYMQETFADGYSKNPHMGTFLRKRIHILR